MSMPLALPNILTLSRIAAIPLLVAACYVPAPLGAWLATAIFVLAALTDWLDGKLARKLRLQSAFGKMFDPIADKLLVASALMLLVGFDLAPLIPCLVIALREFLVSGLREYLAGSGKALPVTPLAKWKTASQMGAITLLLLAPALPAAGSITFLGEALLWLAAGLTAMTGYAYLKEGVVQLGMDEAGSASGASTTPMAGLGSKGTGS
ncbi:MAG: CDP-diacylglycerol--glycerol-3-phosphate 3-phosphatidyltransferase [Geminicoccaceae bacterium]